MEVANWERWAGLGVGAEYGWSGYRVLLGAWCVWEGLRLVSTVVLGSGGFNFV